MEALNERIKRRKRRARRRRWAKRLAVCAVLVMMMLTASPRLVREPAPEEPVPDEAAIGWMIAQSWLSPGDVPGFSAAHPALSERFVRASTGPAPWEAR